MNQYFTIIKNYNLEDYFSKLLVWNTANKAPYHNLYHTLCVMKNCLKIVEYENIDTNIRNLLVASLFHDFNHSQGSAPDSWNVKKAIEIFLEFSQETDVESEKIVDIIKATEYPYVITDLNIEQKIIRDADLLQIFEDNYFQQNIVSLGIEMRKDLKESLEMSLKFYSNLNYYTMYGKKIHTENIESVLNDVIFMMKMFV